jgi:dsRNA-specific ribonuclease
MFVCRYLFLRYYDSDEGLLTRMKTKIENRKTLAHFARLLDFGKFII